MSKQRSGTGKTTNGSDGSAVKMPIPVTMKDGAEKLSVSKGAVDKSIDVGSMNEKLRNLDKLMPHFPSETMKEFGLLLADRLGSHPIVPFGFVTTANLLIYDLECGIDGYTHEPIHSHLVGQPPQVYGVLSAVVPLIAKAVCPEDFAKAVEQIANSIK